MALHPFDEAIALHADGPDVFVGHCGAACWNLVGPFGRVFAAIALRAVAASGLALAASSRIVCFED